jgi:DNA replication licensing factor MCM2
MAEASAKMHLRDHVREDDIDMAIKVVLESFLQAQKVSVRRNLQRCFRRYVTYGEDSNQLLMHQLQTLIVDAEKYKLITKNNEKNTSVYASALENRAKELNIFDLRPFYDSSLFKNHGLRVNLAEGKIYYSS